MFNSFAAAEQLKDRDAFDKAQRAYVSYVRAYKEHQCSFIFQLKQLDYGALANQVATPSSRPQNASSNCNVSLLRSCAC